MLYSDFFSESIIPLPFPPSSTDVSAFETKAGMFINVMFGVYQEHSAEKQ